MVRLGITKVEGTGEFKVYWEENGRYIEANAYYTDDVEDARYTLLDILRRASQRGYNVSIVPNRWAGWLVTEGVG